VRFRVLGLQRFRYLGEGQWIICIIGRPIPPLEEIFMVICPVAIAVGCKKCPIFKICPATRIIGDQKPVADEKKTNPAPAAKQAKATKPASGTKAKKR